MIQPPLASLKGVKLSDNQLVLLDNKEVQIFPCPTKGSPKLLGRIASNYYEIPRHVNSTLYSQMTCYTAQMAGRRQTRVGRFSVQDGKHISVQTRVDRHVHDWTLHKHGLEPIMVNLGLPYGNLTILSQYGFGTAMTNQEVIDNSFIKGTKTPLSTVFQVNPVTKVIQPTWHITAHAGLDFIIPGDTYVWKLTLHGNIHGMPEANLVNISSGSFESSGDMDVFIQSNMVSVDGKHLLAECVTLK